MNKKSNKNEKLDLNKVSGGNSYSILYKNPYDNTFVKDDYAFELRVGKDGVLNSEDVAQLKEAGYYFRNNQLVIDPVGINKTAKTAEHDVDYIKSS